MSRSAPRNDDQPAEDNPKPKATTRKASAKPKAPPQDTVSNNGHKSAPVNPRSMLGADFETASDADQSLTSSSDDIDLQRDDLDAAEFYDLGDTVKSKSKSRNRAGDSIVEELDEIYD